MLGRVWELIKDTANGYVNDECLSRGAAIAYYTVFSVAPLLIIATAIAGFFFGEEAVHGALDDQLRDALGDQAARGVQEMVRGASDTGTSTFATVAGIVVLLITASGVFSELQGALNAIWKVAPKPADQEEGTVSKLLKAKAASIGLVAATGFILLVSLATSAALSVVSNWVGGLLPGTEALLGIANFVVSQCIIAGLFAAIYKVLPDRRMEWRDVIVGAFVTAFLFVIGKTLIGWYLGSSAIGTTFGAASALAILLIWVYYSSQIFLIGAEFTRAYAGQEGSHRDAPVVADAAAPGTARNRAASAIAAAAHPDLAPAPAPQPRPASWRDELSVWNVLGGVVVAAGALRRLRDGGTLAPEPGIGLPPGPPDGPAVTVGRAATRRS